MGRNKKDITPKTIFGRRLSAIIAGKNYSNFEEKFGVSGKQMKNYIKGTNPGADAIIKIAKATGLSTDYLLGLSDISQSPVLGGIGFKVRIVLGKNESGTLFYPENNVIDLQNPEILGELPSYIEESEGWPAGPVGVLKIPPGRAPNFPNPPKAAIVAKTDKLDNVDIIVVKTKEEKTYLRLYHDGELSIPGGALGPIPKGCELYKVIAILY